MNGPVDDERQSQMQGARGHRISKRRRVLKAERMGGSRCLTNTGVGVGDTIFILTVYIQGGVSWGKRGGRN